MANQLHVDLVSPAERVWSGEAEMLVARTTEGELGVLPGHAPLLGQLAEPSQVRIKRSDADEMRYDVSSGFLSVTPAGVTILVERCTASVGHPPAAQRAAG